jgi:mevalonate kinase
MKTQTHVTLKVPGKIMLAGEYAVLEGARAVATSLARFMHVECYRHEEATIIESDFFTQPITLENVPAELIDNPLVELVRWAAEHWRLPAFQIKVASEFAVTDGFGSSSALRLGVLAALWRQFPNHLTDFTTLTGTSERRWHIPRLAWQIQREAQGFASGYDILTQWSGGLLVWQPNYQDWPGEVQITTAPKLDWLQIFRGGRGAPTKEIAGSTRQWLQDQQLNAPFVSTSERLVSALQSSITAAHPTANLYQAVGDVRRLLAKSPHYPHDLLQSLVDLPGCDSSWSFKTSGAGGEDAILLFGPPSSTTAARDLLVKQGWQNLTTDLGCPGLEAQLSLDLDLQPDDNRSLR